MEVLHYLKENKENILLDIENLVKHESPSFDKRLVDECSLFLQSLINERLDAAVTVLPNEKVGNHLKFVLGEGNKRVMILAHYDTVWKKGALPFRVEKNRIHGPGVLDMKAGIIQGIWSLKAIKDLSKPLNCEVVFLLTSDEEMLSPTSRELIEKEAKKCEAVFVVEPAVARSNALKISRKGAAKYTIKVYGTSSHAGNHPDLQASAVHEVAHQIINLEKVADLDKGTTINAGVVNGGTMSNVVADFAQLEVDVRFETQSEGERVHSKIINLKPVLQRTSMEIEGNINRPPMELSDNSLEIFELSQDIASHLGFKVTGESVGGVSDGNFTAAVGVPTLDGLGAVGEGPHATNEHIIIDEIPNRTALLAHLILKM